MPGLLVAFDLSASGLSAMRRKMDATAANIANAETTRTPAGGPYRRQIVVQRENPKQGAFVDLLERSSIDLRRTHAQHLQPRLSLTDNPRRIPTTDTVAETSGAVRYEYMPGHPDADVDGFVALPDIDILAEMVELMLASRAYEANATALEAAKQMAQRALEL
jgi:flagellar basal-body rod protein FlgC